MAKHTGVPVSERALIQRINRKLTAKDEIVKTTRGGRATHDLGRYYILDTRRNWVLHKNLDLEATGRELGVLREYEQVTD